MAELIAVFSDPALKVNADQPDPRTDSEPENADDAVDDAVDLDAPSPTVHLDRRPESLPASREKPVRRTASKRPASKSPAPKRPALTLASNVSGDLAITAPPGTPKPPVPAPSAPDNIAPARVVPDAVAFDTRPPPLPSLSPEDAALKFETMPEAPELHSTIDDQEPLRFAWIKRWPFLTLVPASEVPTRAVQVHGPEARAEAPDPVDTGESKLTPEPAPEPMPEPVPEPTAAPMSRMPVAALLAARDEAPQRPVRNIAEALVSVPSVEKNDERQAPGEEVPVPGIPVDDAVLPEPPPVAVLAAETPVDELAPADPAAGVTVAPVGAPVDDDDDVHAAQVTELLDEIIAAEADDEPIARVDPATSPVVLRITGLSRRFGDTVAVDGIDLDVHQGSFYGIVGPNGAGKTTTLSMVTGLLRPDSGSITVHGVDVWDEPEAAKRSIGVLPDRLRLFDRLTGAQLLYYAGVLRGLDGATVRARTKDLARAFGLEDALNRLVTDYSAGMTKKVALAAAMIHSPRLLVLDEPFESVDPVSAANVIEILQRYVAHGGTVVLSSHGMDLIQRVCDHVAIIVHGRVLAAGAVDDVRGSGTLEERFVELAGGRKAAEGMEWLHSFSD